MADEQLSIEDLEKAVQDATAALSPAKGAVTKANNALVAAQTAEAEAKTAYEGSKTDELPDGDPELLKAFEEASAAVKTAEEAAGEAKTALEGKEKDLEDARAALVDGHKAADEAAKAAEAEKAEEVEEEEDELPTFSYGNADAAMVQYINAYLKNVADPKQKSVALSAKTMGTMFQYAIANPKGHNLAAIKSFFSKFKESILAESVALQGITHLPVKQRLKVETMYTVFRELTTDKRKLNKDRIRAILGDDIVTWLAKQK